MKNYFKGLICGLVLAIAVMCIPVVAENISVAFNGFRINVNGVDVAQWGENYTLDNGSEVPYSMIYNDTTYLPLRKIGELTGKHIAYNGDTGTVSVCGIPKKESVITEKPDANGNVWEYYTFTTDDRYACLGIRDKARGFERVYRSATETMITDDYVLFFRYSGPGKGYNKTYALQKIMFSNDPDTQDGEELFKLNATGVIHMDDEYVYYEYNTAPSTMARDVICVNDINTGKFIAEYALPVWESFIITMIEPDVFECMPVDHPDTYILVPFDRETKRFGEATRYDKGENQ